MKKFHVHFKAQPKIRPQASTGSSSGVRYTARCYIFKWKMKHLVICFSCFGVPSFWTAHAMLGPTTPYRTISTSHTETGGKVCIISYWMIPFGQIWLACVAVNLCTFDERKVYVPFWNVSIFVRVPISSMRIASIDSDVLKSFRCDFWLDIWRIFFSTSSG